jgi:hypothetical protein
MENAEAIGVLLLDLKLEVDPSRLSGCDAKL